MSTFKRWMILVIVSSALILIVMDMTILYTALPNLVYDLGASASEKLWILNGYSLVMAGLLPAMGTLGDRLGYRKIFILGLIVFCLASLIAAFSPTPGILVASRVLLAVGASMMMPATLSIIRVTFTEARELGLALGIWGSVSAGGAGLGPVLGGLLLERYWWGSAFLVNVPIVLIALALTLIYIPKHNGNKDKKWDLLSSIQIMIALVTIVYAIKEITRRGGSTILAVIAAIIGIIAFIIFIRRQRKLSDPLIDLSLFKSSPFTVGFITAVMSSFTLIGIQYLITQKLQLVDRLSPLQAGIFILGMPIASLITGPIAGMMMHRFNVLHIKITALLIAAFGIGIYLAHLESSIAGQMIGLTFIGAGLGATTVTSSHSIMNAAPSQKAGMAASIEEVAFEIGGASGIAIIGSLSGFIYTLAMKIPNELNVTHKVRDSLDEALIVSESLPANVSEILKEAGRNAFNESFFIVVTGVAIFLAVTSIVIYRLGNYSIHTHTKNSKREV
ncbi:MFS transporter [Paenibacillus sp. NPDC058174]|uniref:MFS transporter n=1 Tax=Paenibacillus sp. NPDC058174 TaxID=3346366 RepID=UPI0036D7EFC3